MSKQVNGHTDPLEFFGANPDEIDVGPERKAVKTREVCVCGHPMAHHETIYEGLDTCQESKMYCPCKYKKAVLDVDDLRAFKFDTDGHGRDHALWKGLKKLRKMGKSARTLVDSTCWRCLENRPIEPVPLTQGNYVSRQAEARNVMLCVRCRYVLDGIDPSFISQDVEATLEVVVSPTEPPIDNAERQISDQDIGKSWPALFVSNQPSEPNHGAEAGSQHEEDLPQNREITFEKLDQTPY